ncbi:fibronectin type III domain-containing protein [Pedosphaera parvula]|uniref:Fibronectin type-III domain-containing protein n=1 Tax=Pedosphaera parvula (strain Ellin514) TaxID=320771 RepID=B9XF02_PEDPL|nr:fibronectin type III domain-containing protein [Pedosphaera parvula]EEF61500.1 hypothetical protein Cflav_PD4178 [Pedosphaera parvula Ellin514]
MPLLQRVCRTLGTLCLVVPGIAFGQASYVRQGGEYAPAGNLAADQVHPSVSINTSGGFVVWQDNISDGDGLGISVQKLDNTFSRSFAPFRVNQQSVADQENPQVSLLNNGGAAFVWQGGQQGYQHIYARFLSTSNTWVTGDIMVNATTNYFQMNPVLATLTNGNVIVAWSSLNQDGSMQGVYAQQLTPAGAKVGTEFQVNQYTSYNQRTPTVAALANGNFVIAWVSEQQRTAATTNGPAASVDIYARLYNSASSPLAGEFIVNGANNICANPSVASSSDGGFCLSWSQKDTSVFENSWDVCSRSFLTAGTGGVIRFVNTQRYGDQYAPRIAACGTDYMVIWTSLGQDGSREGVYGQFLHSDGSPAGGEFRVNSSTAGQQIQPTLAADGSKRFLAVWTSYTGIATSFDLFAQRYATSQLPLLAPAKPFATAINSSRLTITWPLLAGFNLDHWELYVDGAATPIIVTTNVWTMSGLAPNSTHTFRLAYVLTDTRHSPLSATATGTTWGSDDNADGLPDDWQAQYWGSNPANWPAPNTLLAPGGPTVLQAFQSGSNPLDPNTWFKVATISTAQGQFLIWNTQPGSVYQVMTSSGIPSQWSNFGLARFAAGTNDSVFLGRNPIGSFNFYKVSRLRY